MQKNISSKILVGLLALLLIVNITAYSAASNSGKLTFGSSEALPMSKIDYSDMSHWLSFGENNDKGVDIFAVYPTVTFSESSADMPYIRIDSPLMRVKAEEWLGRVSGIIMPSGNVYAPLYGQLNGAMLAKLSSNEFESYTNANPRDDVFAAFDYFLKHVNKGKRPFILFGHSQGASLVNELATVFLGNEKYYEHNKNLVIVYAVGYSITQKKIDRNPNLKFSQSKNDTGVIVSWNTTAPSEVASGAYTGFGTWNKDALVTNPICWETDETLEHASSNKASMVPQPDGSYKRVENYANAVVDMEHRVLVTTTVPEADYAQSMPNISRFHQYDMTFFYDSMRQNIKDRIAAFNKK